MTSVLYLVHRLPYPPNKGDKVRSYHLLKFLAARYSVHLGTFVDDPDDERHIDALRPLCASLYVARLSPRRARIGSLRGLLHGEALTVAYYRDRGLATWVGRTVQLAGIRNAIVFSSAMAQYVAAPSDLRVILDCVDVDSAKWAQYSTSHRWPLSAIYRREGRRLLQVESAAVARADSAFFVTEAEAAMFRQLVPGSEGKVATVGNGVDSDFFAPAHDVPSPFEAGEMPIVFTGAMDYWPNVDAVSWFVSEVMQLLKVRWPRLRFYIVGMRPSAQVRSLAGPDVVVTGTVPDVRPYLRHAALVVAPLRLARGIQNKVLEAMAMECAVVVSAQCAVGIDAVNERDLETATDAASFAECIDRLLSDPPAARAMGRAARKRVVVGYSWEARLVPFENSITANIDGGIIVPTDIAIAGQQLRHA